MTESTRAVRISRIITGHKDHDKYARLFSENGVVAVGWCEVGDISGMTRNEIISAAEKAKNIDNPPYVASVLVSFRDEIKVGDPVFAYKTGNIVACVGFVDGEYYFDDSDELGDCDKMGYPHKRKVRWIGEPTNFHRNLLPESVSEELAKRGTLRIFQYDFSEIEESLKEIPESSMFGRIITVESEEQIKNYIINNHKELDENFELVGSEVETSVGNIDVLGKIGDEYVVVEIKRQASDSAVGQILGYMSAFKEENKLHSIRGIILAEDFDPRVKMAVRSLNVSLYQCRLKFEITKM